MFGNNNAPLGSPGGAFSTANYLRPSVIGPMPNVTAGGTLWNNEKMMGPVPIAQFQGGSSFVTNGGIGPAGAPMGTVAGYGHSGSMAGAGFSGAFGRPATVYGRRSYGGYGATDTGKEKLQWWEIVFAPFTWVASAGKGIYNARGGDEGALIRQKAIQKRKTARTEGIQGRKDARVQSHADVVAQIQARKNVVANARAARIATPAAPATTSALDPALQAISDFAASYMTPDANGNLVPLDQSAAPPVDQGYMDQGTDQTSSTWPIVIAGGAAVLGIAYFASKKGKKGKKSKGDR